MYFTKLNKPKKMPNIYVDGAKNKYCDRYKISRGPFGPNPELQKAY